MDLMQKVGSLYGFKARVSDSSGIKCAFSIAIPCRAARDRSKENEKDRVARGERASSNRAGFVAFALANESEHFDLH